MRLIDADLLMRKCEKWLKPKAPDEDEMVSLTDITVSMLMEIEEQPTAFDVEEVVKQLEKSRGYIATTKYCAEMCGGTTCGGKNCFECCLVFEHRHFVKMIGDQPAAFDVEKSGKKLMEIYKLFSIDGSLKRKLTAKEMVMLYHIADVMRGGRDEE